MDQTLYDVDESEEVARILFYLSVWRTLHKTPTRENVTFPPRTPGDEVFGYATLNVGIIHTQDIMDCTARVKRNVKNENHYHVGIFYELAQQPIVGKCDAVSFMALTMALANKATLIPFPKIENSVLEVAK